MFGYTHAAVSSETEHDYMLSCSSVYVLCLVIITPSTEPARWNSWRREPPVAHIWMYKAMSLYACVCSLILVHRCLRMRFESGGHPKRGRLRCFSTVWPKPIQDLGTACPISAWNYSVSKSAKQPKGSLRAPNRFSMIYSFNCQKWLPTHLSSLLYVSVNYTAFVTKRW